MGPSSMYQLALPSTPLFHPSHHHLPLDFRYFLLWQKRRSLCTRTTTMALPFKLHVVYPHGVLFDVLTCPSINPSITSITSSHSC
jgi:hypothetical protein